MTPSVSGKHFCTGCGAEEVFIPEAFGVVCPECGLVEHENIPFDPSVAGNTLGYSHSELQRPTQAIHGLDLTNVWSRKQRRQAEIDRLIRGVLGRLRHPEQFAEVKRLIVQVESLSSLHERNGKTPEDTGENGKSTEQSAPKRLNWNRKSYELAAACIFSVVKQRIHSLSLSDVCSIADIPERDVARCLAMMESTLPQPLMYPLTYDDPEGYVDGHITFLLSELDKRPLRHVASYGSTSYRVDPASSIFLTREHSFLVKSSIHTAAFSHLAHDLARLCSRRGLHNRSILSTAIRRQKDLALCAWAIVVLALEGHTRMLVNETAFARAATWAPGWKPGFKMGGFTRMEFNFVRDGKSEFQSYKTDPDGIEILEHEKNEARRTTIESVEDVVKQRYGEINRMLSVYVSRLPWSRAVNRKRKRANEGQDLIMRLPRIEVAKHLREVVRLQHDIERNSPVNTFPNNWGAYSSSTRSKSRGRAQPSDSLEVPSMGNRTEDLERFSNIHRSLLALMQAHDQQKRSSKSSLAQRLGRTLLSVDTLTNMPDATVDRLLFEPGEMESYIRSTQDTAGMETILQQSENSESSQVFSGSQAATSSEYAHHVPSFSVPATRKKATRPQSKAKDDATLQEILDAL